MFYIQQNEKIVLYDANLEVVKNTLSVMPQYADLEIQETEREIVMLDNEFVFADEHQKEIVQQKQEHIKTLTCTKRVFALMLQELGVDYLTQLKPLIESNPQAQLEWELCVELSRNNPLLDVMASKLGISSEKLDKLFQYANGEITLEVFKGE